MHVETFTKERFLVKKLASILKGLNNFSSEITWKESLLMLNAWSQYSRQQIINGAWLS